MDYKKTNAPTNTVTRDMMELWADTGNVYETVAIIGKRANQISVEIKSDLSKKLAELASYNDNLEEVFENREPVSYTHLDEGQIHGIDTPEHILRQFAHILCPPGLEREELRHKGETVIEVRCV